MVTLISAIAAAGCDPAEFVVAVDAGHSVGDPGATSARGAPEYAFNDRIASSLLARLHDRGFTASYRVDPAGAAMSLARRGAAADRADLLLSVHHDSVQPAYLARWTVDGAEHAYSDAFHGYSIFAATKADSASVSLAAATALADALRAAGLTPSLHHAEPIPGEDRRLIDPERGIYDGGWLGLMRATRPPAVLLECGVLVNRDEELALSTDERRRATVAALVHAAIAACVASDESDHAPSPIGQETPVPPMPQ
jgi:N-acetylmuramoyl-L-alanine amidase